MSAPELATLQRIVKQLEAPGVVIKSLDFQLDADYERCQPPDKDQWPQIFATGRRRIVIDCKYEVKT